MVLKQIKDPRTQRAVFETAACRWVWEGGIAAIAIGWIAILFVTGSC